MKTGPLHPAYSSPDLPVNQTIAYFSDEKNMSDWMEADIVVGKMMKALKMDEKERPLRLCTGSMAYEAIMAGDKAKREEIEKWKDLSVG